METRRTRRFVKDRAASRYRASLALEYRMQGMDYDSIAQELGFANRSGAWKAVDRTLRRQGIAVTEQFFALTMADLDALQERSWRKAMAGDPGALDRCLSAVNQRVRLIERFGQLEQVSA